MSCKSSFLRGVYGVEKRPRVAKSKYEFYRKQRAERKELRLTGEDYLKHRTNVRDLLISIRRDEHAAEDALIAARLRW